MLQMNTYKINKSFQVNCGFLCNADHIEKSAHETNESLDNLPFSLYNNIDYKTTSTIVGRLFSTYLAKNTFSIVNPIEKGHPDLIPVKGANATERELRNYPEGIEIKVTVGNVLKGSDLKRGAPRIQHLTGITWQAHHKEGKEILGLIWDFDLFNEHTPIITGAFFSDKLNVNDWGEISGTTGRNTKVTGLRATGRDKMGKGWILLMDNSVYLKSYCKLLNFNFESKLI
jgi:hypothetical protein